MFCLFSALGLGFIINNKFGQSRGKLGFQMFLLILIGTSVAMVYQLIVSVKKMQNNLKGTNVEYKNTDPNLNISLSICKNNQRWPDEEITKLSGVFSIFQRESEDAQWVENQEINMSPLFMWEENRNYFTYICKTIKFIGEEVKIYHSFKSNPDHAIFFHDPGSLTSGNSLKLMGNIFADNNILLLNIQQIQNIEEANVCSNTIDYDTCRNDLVR